MSYYSIVKNYLSELQSEYNSARSGGQHTIELSFRMVLDKLFRSLTHELNNSGDISIVLEPKNQRHVGRPDWRIHDSKTLGVYGYIEAKGLSKEKFGTAPYKEQINKYLTLNQKLIITDGIDFVFCLSKEEEPKTISLVDKTKLNHDNWSSLPLNPTFEVYMKRFFSDPAPQYCDEGELVGLVAIRTRILADEIVKFGSIPIDEAFDDEKEIIDLLTQIREVVYNHNDREFHTEKVFADFVAQVIMFSLLYAHRAICSPDDAPEEKANKIREFLKEEITDTSSLAPFRKLICFILDHASKESFIIHWTNECVGFLSFVKITDTQILNPDYHKLFELYLAKYDPKSRFDYGAFYTPKELSNYVVRLTEEIVNLAFDGASIYDEGNTLIDPCCGTGTFLEQIVVNDKGNSKYILSGIEISPTPYMLTNYRMSIVEKKTGKKNQSTHIILANTLSDYTFGAPIDNETIEGQELKKVQKITSCPIKLIIGNPPTSDSSKTNIGDDFSVITTLLEDFRPPVANRRARQNTQKQINNPHMQFIRWACDKLMNFSNHSVLSFIVPLSFLENESYRYARKFITEKFSTGWVIALDSDARTGVRSDSLFNTLQGRAVLILVRRYNEEKQMKKFNYLDWTEHTKAEKVNLLSRPINETFQMFSEYNIDDNYSFCPHDAYDEVLYDKFWPISGENGQKAIFIKHCSGIKLAPTALFTHTKKPFLKRRSKEIAADPNAAQEWFNGQSKKPSLEKLEKFHQSMRSMSNASEVEKMLEGNISYYSFRPYLTSSVLLWKDVLREYSRIGGGGTRLRPEILFSYQQQNACGFAMAHAPKDLNPSLTQFVSFCWYYPDNDMCTRGNSHIYMASYPEKQKNGQYVTKNNIDASLLESLSREFGNNNDVSRHLLFYVYAFLCSQLYLDTFEGALFMVNRSDKRARVPIVKDETMFFKLSQLGERLATYEKNDFIPENILGLNYSEIIAEVPDRFKLLKFELDEDNETVILIGENHQVCIPCSVELQRLNISGYNVVKNVWLKFNSYSYTYCNFTKDDMRGFLDFLNKLELHIRCVGEIDKLAFEVLNHKYDLFTPDILRY
jgi:hypothetical protein